VLFFGCFSVFYIRVSSKKQALPTQDLPIMKYNPYGVNLASELTELAYKKVQPALRVGGKGTHTKAGLASQDLPIMKFNPLRGLQTDSPNHRITKSPINYNSWIEVAAVPF
jgi:hypothetical protein